MSLAGSTPAPSAMECPAHGRATGFEYQGAANRSRAFDSPTLRHSGACRPLVGNSSRTRGRLSREGSLHAPPEWEAKPMGDGTRSEAGRAQALHVQLVRFPPNTRHERRLSRFTGCGAAVAHVPGGHGVARSIRASLTNDLSGVRATSPAKGPRLMPAQAAGSPEATRCGECRGRGAAPRHSF